ncbi:hypothetical protein RJ639_041115 [Escallonia herrerae]|uniref:Isopenicillin N synthase-like Fe(2+) 2OG dioxygenase domain-containing protein n=1 Tax=Escallonia herrerae TaxID=1293975 RepID=A0AA88WIC6_9ASTE|nr:hypothetical protein RJ639_041115 [Escallonia herrerae]
MQDIAGLPEKLVEACEWGSFRLINHGVSEELMSEVKAITGELVPVDPMPSTFVINVGDIAKLWSNGRFCNVKHRVQCYEPAIRISVALFVLGTRDTKVETRPELVDSRTSRLRTP